MKKRSTTHTRKRPPQAKIAIFVFSQKGWAPYIHMWLSIDYACTWNVLLHVRIHSENYAHWMDEMSHSAITHSTRITYTRPKLRWKWDHLSHMYLIFSCVRVQNTRHVNLIEKCATNSSAHHSQTSHSQFPSRGTYSHMHLLNFVYMFPTCFGFVIGSIHWKWTQKTPFFSSHRAVWYKRRFATNTNWILFMFVECVHVLATPKKPRGP